jgi:hypothetical protein
VVRIDDVVADLVLAFARLELDVGARVLDC